MPSNTMGQILTKRHQTGCAAFLATAWLDQHYDRKAPIESRAFMSLKSILAGHWPRRI